VAAIVWEELVASPRGPALKVAVDEPVAGVE
jgi:hypothetical protein